MPQKNQTLKESQAQLELALEAAQMGIWDWDIFTGQVNLSPQMETIYGLPAGSFGGTLEDYLACIYSEDIESVGNMIDYALETKTAIEFECRIVRPDGTLVWTSNRGNVLFDETGMPMGMIGATIDCSDRKTAEAATKAAEAKYRNIFENSVVGIYQTLPSGRFLSANPTLAQIYGYSSEQDLINSLTDLDHQLYLDTSRRQQFKDLLATADHIFGFESQVYRQDGSVIWISESARTVRDAKGNMLYYEGTVEDITERKATEASLARANHEISLLNEQLKSENLRMGAELSVTRRLQQMMLPREEELQGIVGLDIFGFMEPASEVGGDYYDVLQHNGRVKIGIGDVTGHGLASGMFMIMVQTAVRALLSNEEDNPIKFLATINQTLYANARRMQSDKTMTLTLLEYAEGWLALSGQHEDILVVRTDQTIEQISTLDLGFPLGLEPDIQDFIGVEKIFLNHGDMVILYTDGITEAVNLDNQQYGLERMKAVLQKSPGSSACTVCEALIADLKKFIGDQRVFDDITLLILKRI